MKIKRYFEYITESNSYKELEFLCHNSKFDDSTPKDNQRNFFNALKKYQKDNGYNIIPYMQDFSDDEHDEISLAVVITDTKNYKKIEQDIFKLANEYNIEFDLYNNRTDKEVDKLVKGNLYDNIITESTSNEYIAYHSTDSEISEFNFDDIQTKPNSSTRIDGIFFSNIPQKSWGKYTYKVKLISNNPAIFDISKSRFDSLGIQEAFDTLLRGNTSYIIEDLIEYGDMDETDAEDLAESWTKCDLIIIKNSVYASHDIEYIVPDPYYNKHSAKIINLGLID